MNTLYEVVRQHNEDSDYFTIFNGQEQYCDEDGNPIRYDNFEDAKSECDILNNERSKE